MSVCIKRTGSMTTKRIRNWGSPQLTRHHLFGRVQILYLSEQAKNARLNRME